MPAPRGFDTASRMTERARRAVATDRAFLALGHETFVADGARFVRDRALPAIHDANFVTDVTATTPGDLARLLARVEREFAGGFRRHFLLDAGTPAGVEAELVLRGYEHSATLLMVLDGPLRTTAPAHEIRAIRDDADWDAYARLKQRDWDERAARLGLRGLDWIGPLMARAHRGKSPPVTFWLALVDGTARGFVASWPGRDGMGQVEDLYVEPEVRRRGLATALVAHGVADCRARGAGAVMIAAEATDTPKVMYAAMGFVPAALAHKYLLRLPRP